MSLPIPKLLVDIFSPTNPHWARTLQYTSETGRVWYGEKRDAWPAEGEVRPLHHVFPTVSNEDSKLGLMVGISAKPASEGGSWQLSDAFGRLGYGEGQWPLDLLLTDVETIWENQEGTYLPLRWLTPIQFKLLTPIHLELIRGKSLQVPLVVALLRVACSPNDPEKMPWGAGPVFCTGELDNGFFDQVDDVEAKLRGFIREFGPKRVALLTLAQQDTLSTDLKSQIKCVTANSLGDLLALPPVRAGLTALVNTPPDLYRHFAVMESKDRQQHFKAVRQLIDWMNGHITEAQPYHFIKTRLRKAALYDHDGKFTEALNYFEQAAQVANSVVDKIGIDLRLAVLTRGASTRFLVGRPETAVGPLEELRENLQFASPRQRTAYWGTLCQQYRALGKYDEAVDAGECAVKSARFGCKNELYRDLNYLAHAHIARARVWEAHRSIDLVRAIKYLDQSEGPEGPPEGSRSQQTNRLFCNHLRQEIARISGIPCDCQADMNKETYDTWEHPLLFSLLSLVRTSSVADRGGLANQLLSVSRKFMTKGSIFRLFDAVYRLYVNAVVFAKMDASTTELRAVLDDLAYMGADGWRDRLAPLLDQIDEAPQNLKLFESLCDAVYFH